ncbi:MAG: addiction module antitoxin, RelB/DinJ family [Candidatus Nitrotoga sp. MKT]|nr:MAG: addiction module antitoxin, RelB/DinJ family [Candidatus Nitrotoga sp. MKT]
MAANTVVRARIDEHIKEEATVVLAAMGLTISDACRIMLTPMGFMNFSSKILPGGIGSSNF